MRTTAATLAFVASLTAACSADDPASDSAPAPTPTSSSPSGVSSTPPAGPVAWIASLPIGPPPQIGYAIGHTYHTSGGRTVRLPHDFGITSIATLGTGYLVTSDHAFEGSTGIFQLDRHGRIDLKAGQPGHVPGAATVAEHPMLSADGRMLHWLTFTPPESGLHLPTLLHSGSVVTGDVISVEVDLDPLFLTSVVGLVGDDVVIRAGWGGSGRVSTHNGTTLSRTPALDQVWSISPRSRLGAARLGPNSQAAGVVDVTTGAVLWRHPRTYPGPFSPSGRRLLVSVGNRLAVVDARTGDVVSSIPRPDARRVHWYSGQVTWEDEEHLLTAVQHDDRAAVVRIDVATGDLELAVDWTPEKRALYVAFETVY